MIKGTKIKMLMFILVNQRRQVQFAHAYELLPYHFLFGIDYVFYSKWIGVGNAAQLYLYTIPAFAVPIGNRYKIGRCFTMPCNSTIVAMQY